MQGVDVFIFELQNLISYGKFKSLKLISYGRDYGPTHATIPGDPREHLGTEKFWRER